jgi:hypothetical protein
MVERDSPFFTMWVVSAHAAGAAMKRNIRRRTRE